MSDLTDDDYVNVVATVLPVNHFKNYLNGDLVWLDQNGIHALMKAAIEAHKEKQK